MSSAKTKEIKLEDQTFFPAQIDGYPLVYKNPDFKLVRRYWQPDESAQTCCICNSKFGGLKRRHHCRQCGRVVCNKCCNEKVLLPQYGYTEAERLCDPCRPITDVVVKARADQASQQYEAAQGLAELCKDPRYIIRLVSYGGFHSILALAGKNLRKNTNLMDTEFDISCTLSQLETVCIKCQILLAGKTKKVSSNILSADIVQRVVKKKVVSCLHILSTYEQLLDFMVEAGTIPALCDILAQTEASEEYLLLDGVSALLIFCRSNRFKLQALEAGTLPVILNLCGNQNEKVALIALTCLSVVVEKKDIHKTIVDDDRQALPSLLTLSKSENSQSQALALKCLTNLSLGSDWNKHRIVQEDYSAGKVLKSVLLSDTDNIQVLCNSACLIANLATSQEDQASLLDSLAAMIQMLQSDVSNIDLLNNVTRGLANFSKYPQNTAKLRTVLPEVIKYCLKHPNLGIVKQGLRIVFNLLSIEPSQTSNDLSREGAGLILQLLADDKNIVTSIKSELMKQVSDLNTPL